MGGGDITTAGTPDDAERAIEAGGRWLRGWLQRELSVDSGEMSSTNSRSTETRPQRRVAFRAFAFEALSPSRHLDRPAFVAVDPPPITAAPARPPTTDAARACRRAARERAATRRRRRRRRLAVLFVVLVVLSPALYSYISTMLMPSSLPLGVRSVEWLRSHHGNWLVDEVESVYYRWKTPAKGGPQLKTLPKLGIARPAAHAAARSRARRHGTRAHAHTAAWPPRVKPVFPHPLPGEGVWVRTGPLVNGGPPMLLTTFRTERDYPRIVAYVAWFDHTRTALALYPGRYEPPNAIVRGPMSVPQDQRWRLLATFNGGFTYIDGGNGSAVNGADERAAQGRPCDAHRLPQRHGEHRRLEGRPGRRTVTSSSPARACRRSSGTASSTRR